MFFNYTDLTFARQSADKDIFLVLEIVPETLYSYFRN